MESEKKPEKKPFIEREWTEDTKGEYDQDGFFVTPNGSFWDADNVYFNREGFDRHGGRYDEHGEYIPGEGWDDNLNCYESEKEAYHNEKEEEDELDEGYTEEAMMKELAQFDDDDLFEGKDLIKEDPNIEKVVKHENDKEEKDEFMDEINEEKKDKKNQEDDLEEREDDEYEEIEDEEKEDTKEEKNKNKEKNANVINIEKEKKVFVVKTKDGDVFEINGNSNNSNKIEQKNEPNKKDNQFNTVGIEYEINYIDQKWKNKYNNYYKDKHDYKDFKNYKNYKDYKDYKDYNHKDNYKKNKKYNNKKQFKNYNIFDDDEKK